MDWITCEVQLAGDMRNTVVRGSHNPVSWPEMFVLQAIHGPDSVINIRYDRSDACNIPHEEYRRLQSIYSMEYLTRVYPGGNPNIQLEMPESAKNAAEQEANERAKQAVKDAERAKRKRKPVKTINPDQDDLFNASTSPA